MWSTTIPTQTGAYWFYGVIGGGEKHLYFVTAHIVGGVLLWRVDGHYYMLTIGHWQALTPPYLPDKAPRARAFSNN